LDKAAHDADQNGNDKTTGIFTGHKKFRQNPGDQTEYDPR
jgi:hypothetical protein